MCSFKYCLPYRTIYSLVRLIDHKIVLKYVIMVFIQTNVKSLVKRVKNDFLRTFVKMFQKKTANISNNTKFIQKIKPFLLSWL